MPIIPVLTPEQDFSPPRMAVPDVNDLKSAYAARNAAGIVELNTAVGQIVKQRQELADSTDAANAYMTGSKAMRDNYTTVLSDPSNHLDAPKTISELNQKSIEQATKGLRGDVATHVQRQLIAQQIGYDNKALALRLNAQKDNAAASLVTAHDQVVQDASRLDVSDAEAMTPVLPHLKPGETYTGTSEEQATSGGKDAYGKAIPPGVTPGHLEQIVNQYVKDGLMSKTEGATYLQNTREAMAYSRAVRLASDSPTEYQALMKKEDNQQGTTFLRYLDPVKRASLSNAADARVKSLENEALQAKDRERRETDRDHAEMIQRTEGMAALKLSNPKEYGQLDQAWLDQALSLRLLSEEKYEHFKSQVQTQAVQGGTVDPLTVRRFDTELYNPPKSYAATQQDLMANRSKLPPEYYRQAMNGIEEKVRAEKSGKLDPELKEKTTKSMELARTALRATSPFEKLEPTQAVELTGIMRALDNNQFSVTPRDPRDILAELLPGAQARTKLGMETIAAGISKSQRQALNLPPRALKDDQTVAKKTAELVQEYQALPPSDSRRAQIKAQLQQLRELNAVEKAMDDADAYEKRNPTSNIPTTASTAPMPIRGRR